MDRPGTGAVCVPYGLEISHGLSIALAFYIRVDGDGRSVIVIGEDVFLTPGGIDVGALVGARLGVALGPGTL